MEQHRILNYYIPVELNKGVFAIPSYIQDFTNKKNKEGIKVIVYAVNGSTAMKVTWEEINFLAFEYSKFKYNTYHIENYNLMYVNYVPNHTFTNDDAALLVLLGRLHYNWFNPLQTWFLNDYVKTIVPMLHKERSTSVVYPDKEDIFKAFKTDINSVKLVFIGEDPYPAGNHATGLAFATKQPTKPKSLQLIENAIKKDYPQLNSDEITLEKSLEDWTKRGILLLNSSLTVKENVPNSHFELWKIFIGYSIKLLNSKNKRIVFVLLGDKAKHFKNIINEEKHIVIEREHPLTAVQNSREWDYKNLFLEIDKNLNIKINWLNI